MQAFILAGGFATRLWPLTERRAKPLLPLQGKPLLSYMVEAVPPEIPITVSTNAVFAEDFKKWKMTVHGRNITVSIEDVGHEDQKLGALGAVARWIREDNINDDVLLLAGDNYAATDMRRFLSLFRGNPLVAGHDIGEIDLARAFGTIILENLPSPLGGGVGGGGAVQQVKSFEEKPLNPKSTIISTGWWVLPRSALPVLKEYAKKHPDNVGGIFEEFLRRKIAVDCFVFKDLWKDIGSFDAYMSLHRDVVGNRVIADRTAKVSADSVLNGSIDIGPGTTVSKSTLEDCIVFGNSAIEDSRLTRCIIDEGCDLRGVDLTDKMLRARTVLQLQ